MAYPNPSGNLARYQLGAQNRRVFGSMGVQNPQQQAVGQMASGILSGGMAPQPNDLSSFGRRLLNAPGTSGPMINNRGMGGFEPTMGEARKPLSMEVNNYNAAHVPGAPQGQRLYTQPLDGSRPRFMEGRTIPNAAGGMTQITRTPTGGLAFASEPGQGGLPMTPELQARLSQRAQMRRDSGILRAARRNGLGNNVPAVAMARERFAARQGSMRQAAAAQNQMREAELAQHMEHMQSLPTAEARLQYLQGLRNMLGGGRRQQGQAQPPARPSMGREVLNGY